MNIMENVTSLLPSLGVIAGFVLTIYTVIWKHSDRVIRKSSHKVSLLEKGIIDNDDITKYVKEEIINQELSSFTKLYNYKYNVLYAYIMHKSKSRIRQFILRKFISNIIIEDNKLTTNYKINWFANKLNWLGIITGFFFIIFFSLYFSFGSFKLIYSVLSKESITIYHFIDIAIGVMGNILFVFSVITLKEDTPTKSEMAKFKKQLSEIKMDDFHKLNLKLPLD